MSSLLQPCIVEAKHADPKHSNAKSIQAGHIEAEYIQAERNRARPALSQAACLQRPLGR